MMVSPAGGTRAFDPIVSVGILPDGRIIVSDSITWSLKVVRPNGELEKKLVRPFQPRAVTARDREAERDRRRAGLQEGQGVQVMGGAPGMPGLDAGSLRRRSSTRIEGLRFAEQILVIQKIRTDWEGRTWCPADRSQTGGSWSHRCHHSGRCVPGHHCT